VGFVPKLSNSRLLEPDVDTSKIPSSHRSPCKRGARRDFLHSPFWIKEVHCREMVDPVSDDLELTLPDRLAPTTTLFTSLPQESHAPTEIGRRKWSLGLNNVGAVEYVHAL